MFCGQNRRRDWSRQRRFLLLNSSFVLTFDESATFAFSPGVIAEMAERHRQCERRVEVGAGHIGCELRVAFPSTQRPRCSEVTAS